MARSQKNDRLGSSTQPKMGKNKGAANLAMDENAITLSAEDVEIALVDSEEMDDTAEAEDRDEFGFTPEEVEEQLCMLCEALDDVENDQRDWRESIQTWRKQLDAEPRQKEKSWPMPNSSNISPPLAQIHGQGIGAALINYFGQDTLFKVKALQDADEARLKASFMTRYLKLLCDSPSDLNFKPVLRELCLENAVIGQVGLKVPFTKKEWRFRTAPGDSVRTMVGHHGPEVQVILPEDLYFPKEWPNVQTMPWIMHVMHMPEHELYALQSDGTYENVDEVVGHCREVSTKAEADRDETAGRNGSPRKGIYDIVEAYFYYDADGDGYVEDHIWTFDRESRTILRREYNSLGQRPFRLAFYQKRVGELSGRGTGKMCESMQDEVEGLHNTRNDNIKIVSMRMMKMTRTVAETNGEALYPGKTWLVDNMQEMEPLQLGEVYPSSLQEEQFAWNLTAQATGMSEVQRGFSDPRLGTRDTFRGQAMRASNANSVFTTVADQMAVALNEVGMLILYQLVAHSEEIIARERVLSRLIPEDLAMLEDVLSKDVTEIPSMFAFTVDTEDSSAGQQGQMQMLGQISQWFQIYAQQVSPLAGQLFGPAGQQMLAQAPEYYKYLMGIFTGSTKLLDRMMKVAGFDDPSNFLPDTRKWDLLMGMIRKQEEQNIGGLNAVDSQTEAGFGGAAAQGGPGGGQGGYASPNTGVQGAGGYAGMEGTRAIPDSGGRGGQGGSGNGGGGVQALPSAGFGGSLA